MTYYESVVFNILLEISLDIQAKRFGKKLDMMALISGIYEMV